MTGALDATARAVAGKLIDKIGKALTFTAPPTTYSRTTGAVSGGGTTYAWNGVISSYREQYPNGDVSKFGKTVLIVPLVNTAGTAATFTPDTGWQVTIGTEKPKIVNVETVYSGELGAVWILELDQ